MAPQDHKIPIFCQFFSLSRQYYPHSSPHLLLNRLKYIWNTNNHINISQCPLFKAFQATWSHNQRWPNCHINAHFIVKCTTLSCEQRITNEKWYRCYRFKPYTLKTPQIWPTYGSCFCISHTNKHHPSPYHSIQHTATTTTTHTNTITPLLSVTVRLYREIFYCDEILVRTMVVINYNHVSPSHFDSPLAAHSAIILICAGHPPHYASCTSMSCCKGHMQQ